MTPCFRFAAEAARKLVSINERLAIGTQHSASGVQPLKKGERGKKETEETAKALRMAEC